MAAQSGYLIEGSPEVVPSGSFTHPMRSGGVASTFPSKRLIKLENGRFKQTTDSDAPLEGLQGQLITLR